MRSILLMLGLGGCVSPHLIAWDLGPWSSLEAGERRSCGLATVGTVHCWGAELYDLQETPVGRYVAVSIAEQHACALDEVGRPVCWGAPSGEEAPAETLVSMSAGHEQSCGITMTGRLSCWGEGDEPPELERVTAVSMGHGFGCVLDEDGLTTCWGTDFSGQTEAPDTPFAQVAVGRTGACGLTTEGRVECWGSISAPPEEEVFTAIDCDLSCCGLLEDGQARCWQGTGWEGDVPEDVLFQQISAGVFHTCGVDLEGEGLCWGMSDYGALEVPEDPG